VYSSSFVRCSDTVPFILTDSRPEKWKMKEENEVEIAKQGSPEKDVKTEEVVAERYIN